MYLRNPGIKNDEQVTVRHADASLHRRSVGGSGKDNRGEDAGDLKRTQSEFTLMLRRDGRRYIGEVLELNVLEKKICKVNPKILEEKSWRTWKSNQNIFMEEELVQNGVMDEKFVKNFVMDAKIDPKVEMDLPIFKISGWNILQHSKRKLLGESTEEDELQLLLVGNLSRLSFLVIQYSERHFMSVDSNVKELMPLSEDIQVTTQGHMQQGDVEWRRTYIVERIYEDEIHEHSGGVFKDAIGIE